MSKAQNTDGVFIETGKNDKLLAIRTFLLQHSPLGWIIIHRLVNDRDLKMLITSKGNTTGTGKTTLGIMLAREFRRWTNDLFNRSGKWKAKDYAFMNEQEYINKYLGSETGDILITDELETMVDKRRSMSHGNVQFTQLWQEMRFLNVITIGTAPGLHNLDKRIFENTDIWINVISPGKAYVYFLSVDDFEGTPIYRRLQVNNFRMSLYWLPQDDKDYNYMKNLKAENAKRYKNWGGKITEKDVKETEKEVIDTIILNVIEENEKRDLGLTQEDIAENVLDGMRSQQYISKVKRENKK